MQGFIMIKLLDTWSRHIQRLSLGLNLTYLNWWKTERHILLSSEVNIPFYSSSLFKKKKKLGKSNLSLLMIPSICIHSKNFYSEKYPSFFGFCCCSVGQSCLTLCDPMDCAAHQASPSFTISWSLVKLMSVELVMPSNHLILCHPFSSCPQSFPASRSFPVSQLFFAAGGQSIGVSASVSVPPMNMQSWSPLGLTGLISLQSKGLSRVFCSTSVQKQHFFSTQPSLWSNSHIHTWPLEKP